jgi:apolipoprotein N-acyltransferase
MYLALVALAAYLGCYFPVFVWLVRRAVSRGLPLWCAAPVIWTALEYLRSWLFTGFSWYYLGHSQYQWTPLIQFADITGTWGISFLLAWFAGLAADSVPQRLLLRSGIQLPAGCGMPGVKPWLAFGVVFAGCWIYGLIRRQTAFPRVRLCR